MALHIRILSGHGALGSISPSSALLPGVWGCAGAEGTGGSTLVREAEAVAVQSAEFPWR